MHYASTVNITNAADPISVQMGGTSRDIPIIHLGSEYESGFEISLNSHLLTPAEQGEWLRNFAVQVLDLAAQAESVGTVTA